MGKDDGGGAMDGELPTLPISLTGVSLNFGMILAPPLPGVIRGGCKPRVESWMLCVSRRQTMSRTSKVSRRSWTRRAASRDR